MVQILQKYLKYLAILLISRHHFKNWLSAGLKYFLLNKNKVLVKVPNVTGKPSISVKCRDNSTLILPPKLFRLLLNGLFNGLFDGVICTEKVIWCRDFAVPLQELLASEDILDAIRLGWRYYMNYGYWLKNSTKFKHMRHYILEVFDYGEYRYLDVKGRIVVDVGAGFGETAIYFILRGAKLVIAVEPCPDQFRELLENLKLNNAVDKVTPINAALTSTHSSIIIKCPSGEVTVNTVTLEDIAEKFDIRGAVLKMDCEGCEYDVVLNDYEHVRLFDEIYFEYHAFITKIPVEILFKKLSKDFKCEIVSDGDFYRRHGCSRKLLGLVKCIKKH